MLGAAELPLALLLWGVVMFFGGAFIGLLFAVVGNGIDAFKKWRERRLHEELKRRFIDLTTGVRK